MIGEVAYYIREGVEEKGRVLHLFELEAGIDKRLLDELVGVAFFYNALVVEELVGFGGEDNRGSTEECKVTILREERRRFLLGAKLRLGVVGW